MTELKIGSEVYVLEKIKQRDEDVFLDGCDMMGDNVELGFWKIFILFWMGGAYPRHTIQFYKADSFFEERKRNLEKNKINKVMKFAIHDLNEEVSK